MIDRAPSRTPWDSQVNTAVNTDNALSRAEVLDRDRRRAEAIRAHGPGSLLYVEYGLKLRGYAFHVLMRQWRKKSLLPIVRERTRIGVPEPPTQWGAQHFRSIIGVAVSSSVEPFLEAAILHKEWNADGGASISTFFVGRCYYTFADEYRREHRTESRAYQALTDSSRSHLDLELDTVRYIFLTYSSDPESTSVNRAEIRRLLQGSTHSRIPEIIFLLAEGLTAKEVGCHLGLSENAVNKALGRFRSDVGLAGKA